MQSSSGAMFAHLKTGSEDSLDSSDELVGTPSQSDQDNHGTYSRKRRRGIIEKKRRDRINSCLAELRRLVPAAFEKQGSQKLEKAEILQMTVEHLRFLQSKGVDSLLYEPHRLAIDYQSMGYRECVSEVARFLNSDIGLEHADPLRLRLLSHLQCYGQQRVHPAFVSTAATAAMQQWGVAAAATSSQWWGVQNSAAGAINYATVATANQQPAASFGGLASHSGGLTAVDSSAYSSRTQHQFAYANSDISNGVMTSSSMIHHDISKLNGTAATVATGVMQPTACYPRAPATIWTFANQSSIISNADSTETPSSSAQF